MKQRILILAAVIGLIGGYAALPASAHHNPNHRPKPTTTTTAAPPTTTTTLPPTTTTTTTTPPTCGGPITITVGGTYTGCYQSTNAGVPAVTLATAQPVTFDHATIKHKGMGIEDTVTGAQLTLLDSTFEQSDPGAVVKHRAVELERPASFVAEYNRLIDTDGFWIGGTGSTTNPVRVRFNYATNIGRYPHPTSPNCCVQFIQMHGVTSPGIEIAWNKVVNTPGQSDAEDIFNAYESGGTDSAHRGQWHHNLGDGSYDRNLAITNDFGSGLNIGDAGDHHNFAYKNVLVGVTNAGLGLHETDNYADDNLVVSDGSPQSDSDGQAVLAFQNVNPPGVHATNTRYNFTRSPGGQQWPCYFDFHCSGGVQVSLTEQQARDEWEAMRAAAGVTVGPRPF